MDEEADGGPAGELQPAWLTPQERAAWLALGALLTRLPAAMDADLHAAAGLSLFEYLVLAMLSEAPAQSMCMGELGAKVNSSPSRLSHAVARLQRRGWVRRAPLPEDGRRITASLTAEGYCKVQSSAPQHVRFVRHAVIDLLTPAQLSELHAIADAIKEHLRSDQAGCAPESTPCPSTVVVDQTTPVHEPRGDQKRRC